MTSPVLDPFAALRATTPARIGLGRSGDALPIAAQLDLQEAHARARDAVHGAMDVGALARALAPRETIPVHSLAPDRATYLRRPDLGRALDPRDLALLDPGEAGFDLVFVVADGLSASAVAAHAAGFLDAAFARLGPIRIAPVVLAAQARVAIGDGIATALGARMVAVLIGERPGLSVSDSLGIYLTANPRVGIQDSERNCISNVHARGLSYAEAADLLAGLVAGARRLGRTGIDLKPDPRLGPPGELMRIAPRGSAPSGEPEALNARGTGTLTLA